jgi:hypothetical protein
MLPERLRQLILPWFSSDATTSRDAKVKMKRGAATESARLRRAV